MFKVCTIAATEMPQKLVCKALLTSKGDHLDGLTAPFEFADQPFEYWNDTDCGQAVTQYYSILGQKDPNYGLYTPFDHPSLTLDIEADHYSLFQLIVKSSDITFNLEPLKSIANDMKEEIVDFPHSENKIEDWFYVRQPGNYPDFYRHRNPFTPEHREELLAACSSAVHEYSQRKDAQIDCAERLFPMNILQKATASGSLRTWLRLLDINSRPHNSYEMQSLIQLIADEVSKWTPQIYSWWSNNYRSQQFISF